jgi:hypothetical protein
MRQFILCFAATLALIVQPPSVGVTLRGNVRDGGKPAQAYIYALSLQKTASAPRSTVSRPDGTYTLDGILPGEYRIVASVYPEEIPYSEPEALKPWLLRGRTLTVVRNTTPTLDLQVEPYD